MVDVGKLREERRCEIKQLKKQWRTIVMSFLKGKVSFKDSFIDLCRLRIDLWVLESRPIPIFKCRHVNNFSVGERSDEFVMSTKGRSLIAVNKLDPERIVKGLYASDFDITVPAREVSPWECSTGYFVGHSCTYKGLEYKLMGSMRNDYFNPMSINEQPDISRRWKLK